MALTTPTIREIAEGIVSDIESKLNQTIPVLAKNVFRVLAYGVASAWMLLYKNGTWQLNQIFPQTASEKYLELLGENKKIPRVPAIAWEGEANVTYTLAPPGGYREVEAGEQLINVQTQVIYVVTVTTAIDTPGGNDIPIKAASVGEITNLQVDDELKFLNSDNLPDETIPVSLIITEGSDAEDLEVYRQRVIDAFQKQPQGGSLADYEKWAEETPDIINAYPYPSTLPTDVEIYIEAGDQVDGVPTQNQKDDCLDYVTYDPVTGIQDRKPVTDDITIHGITRTAFDVEITGLDPSTAAIKAAVQAAVAAYFLAREPYILGLSTIKADVITKAGVTAVAGEAAELEEATFTDLDLEQGGNPVTSYTLGDGEKAKLNGNITWIP